MDTDTQKLIQDQIAKLPPEIKEVLSKADWSAKMTEIGKKYQLHLDQLGAFQTETMLVLIGLTHPNQYMEELKKHLNVSEGLATTLAGEVNEQILKGVRQKLIETYNSGELENKPAAAESESELSTIEEGVLKKSDIEIDKPKMELRAPSIVETDRTKLLTEIENPPASRSIPLRAIPMKPASETAPAPVFKEKIQPAQNIANQPTPLKQSDPYREMPI